MNSKHIFDLFKKISKDNLVVIVSHDLDNAYVYADRIIELKDGEIVNDIIKTTDFNIEEIKKKYDSEIKNSFIKNKNETTLTCKISDGKIKNTSKLSFKNAFHILKTWLKKNVVSLIISTIILSVVLGAFGLMFNINAYSYSNALASTLQDNDVASATLVKGNIDDSTKQIELKNEAFTEEEFSELTHNLGNMFKCYSIGVEISKYIDEKSTVFDPSLQGFCEIDDEINSNNLKDFYNSKLLCGTYPKRNSDVVEILISDYIADSMLYFGIKFSNGILYPNSSYDSIIGKIIDKNYIKLKIVGIYTSNCSDCYKDENESLKKENLAFQYAKKFVYPIALSCNGYLKEFLINSLQYQSNVNLKQENDSSFYNYNMIFYGADNLDEVKNITNQYFINVVYSSDNLTTIEDNQIIISFSNYLNIFNKHNYDSSGNLTNKFSQLTPTDLDNLKIIEEQSDSSLKEYTVIGVFNDSISDSISSISIVSKNTKYSYIQENLKITSTILKLGSKKQIKSVLKKSSSCGLVLYSPYTDKLLQFTKLFDIISDIINYIVIALFVFVAILMFGIISKNVREKKKDIGILRSLGANRKDILKIFLLYDIVYVIFSFVLASIIYTVGTFIVNTSLCANLETKLSILSISPLTYLLIPLLSALIIFISSLKPILKYTKIAPINVIKQIDN